MVANRLGISAICAVLVTTASWAGQNQPAVSLTLKDIIATAGSDADAHLVIAKVLTHAMAQGERRKYFLMSQIRNEWLPVIPGVELVRLADSEIAGHLSGCGVYWIISRFERADNVVSMWLQQKCGGSGRHYIVSFDGNEWRLGPPGTGKDGGGWAPGIGSGIPMPQPDCPCLGR